MGVSVKKKNLCIIMLMFLFYKTGNLGRLVCRGNVGIDCVIVRIKLVD